MATNNLFFFITILLISRCLCQEYVLLDINQGTLNGTVKYDRKGGSFYSFQRIPFGKPPIGDLRFKEPHQADAWDGILDATKDLPQCIQLDYLGGYLGQEDCLYLNVYTPQPPSETYNIYKDVMVFIHGGGFYENSGSEDLYSPQFLMTEDIVLVTINYRLGIFGAFHLEDSSLEYFGNLGLKDQSLAMKWVKENIDRFGGNTNSITLFGESAGAVSVHYHVLSPLSAGTFHKAIIQSGTAISPWVLGVPNNGILLAEVLEVETNDVTVMMNEILKLSAGAIFVGQQKLDELPTGRWASANFPIIEDDTERDTAFLTKEPLEVIRSGNYNQVPMIVGYNDAEGISFHYMYSELFNLIPGDLDVAINTDNAAAILEEIKNFYFNGSEPSFNDSQPLIDIFTDVWFSYPVHRFILEHKNTTDSPIYVYRFSADTKLNVYKLRFDFMSGFPGATHCDELGYLFSTYYHRDIIPEIIPNSIEDRALDRLVKLWTNFAKYGNPTPEDFEDLQWIPATKDAMHYIDFGSSETIAGINPDAERNKFWSDIYDKYSRGIMYSNSRPLWILLSICSLLFVKIFV